MKKKAKTKESSDVPAHYDVEAFPIKGTAATVMAMEQWFEACGSSREDAIVMRKQVAQAMLDILDDVYGEDEDVPDRDEVRGRADGRQQGHDDLPQPKAHKDRLPADENTSDAVA